LLAGPAAASALLNNAFRVIDQQAAGGIGTAAQAAIGSSTFVFIAIYAIHQLAAAGAAPLIGRATGAGDPEQRRRIVGSGLVFACGLGVAVALVGAVAAPGIATLLGLTGDSHRDAALFLQTLMTTGILAAFFPLVDAAFVAMGRTRTMMLLQVGSAVLNALLNPILIHALGLGVVGAALATSISRSLGVLIGLWLLWRDLGLGLRHLTASEIPRIFRVGLPVGSNTLAYAFAYWALLHFTISPLGPEVNAALGIGFSALEGVSYPIFLGLSLAVSSLVSRRLGAGQPEEAVRVGRLAIRPAILLGLGIGSIFFFLAAPLCGFFTHDPKVLAAAVAYAQILAFSQIFVATEALAEGVLLGAGDSRTVFRWSMPLNLARVPVAWFLAFGLGWGAAGVWWAINLTSFLKAAGKGRAAWRGDWLRLRL
jgi:MATE family multidrug resistance protein